MLMVPSVTISDEIRNFVETKPLMKPNAVPVARLISTVSQVGRPRSCQNPTTNTEEIATIAPTDRSIPPTSSTNIWPIATTAVRLDTYSTLVKLTQVKNTGEI